MFSLPQNENQIPACFRTAVSSSRLEGEDELRGLQSAAKPLDATQTYMLGPLVLCLFERRLGPVTGRPVQLSIYKSTQHTHHPSSSQP